MALQWRPSCFFTANILNNEKSIIAPPHHSYVGLGHTKHFAGRVGLRSSTIAMSAASPASASPPSPSTEAAALSEISIFTCDGKPVQFQKLWDQENGTAVVAFLRHFGCPLCWEFAASLRDAKPKFDAASVNLIAIGVGTADKAQLFAERLPFPKEILFADPDRKAQVINRVDSIREALKGYTLDATPRDRSSVLQQGGLYIFKGRELLYARKDEGTGDHASLDDVFNICCSVPVA